MYFLTGMEKKYLLNSLLPKIREVGVTPELRGWNWHQSPLKPYYDVKLPMYTVCNKYCPTSRDVFMRHVENKKGEDTYNLLLGLAIHETIGTAFLKAKNLNFHASFDEFYRDKKWSIYDSIVECARKAWDFVLINANSRYLNVASEQPYMSKEDIVATAIPFLTEHRISGRLLGLSGILNMDCYDYMRNIIFDVKVMEKDKQDYRFRLYPTGYALVMESVYDIPVDIGCTVYLDFKENKMFLERDIFHIDDNLRSWWIEERDKKAEIVAEEKDPGFPKECYPLCIYRNLCGD